MTDEKISRIFTIILISIAVLETGSLLLDLL